MTDSSPFFCSSRIWMVFLLFMSSIFSLNGIETKSDRSLSKIFSMNEKLELDSTDKNSTWYCDGYSNSDSAACSGHGECLRSGICECQAFYFVKFHGKECSEVENMHVFVFPLAISLVVIVLLCLNLCLVIICVMVFCKKKESSVTLAKKKVELLKRELKSPIKEKPVATGSTFLEIRHTKDVGEFVKETVREAKVTTFLMSEICLTSFCYSDHHKALFLGRLMNGKKVQLQCQLEKFELAQFQREIEVFRKINLKNRVHFVDLLGVAFRIQNTEEYGTIALVREVCRFGDLKSFVFMNKEREFSMRERLRLVYEMACPIAVLHNSGFIHRDVKPENYEVNGGLMAKLSSFRCSILSDNSRKSIGVGSLQFIAPEIFSSDNYNELVDVFSWSISAFCVLALNFQPYNLKNGHLIAQRVLNSPEFRPSIDLLSQTHTHHSSSSSAEGGDRRIIDEFTNLLRKSWSAQPSKRPPISRVVKVTKRLWKACSAPVLVYLERDDDTVKVAKDLVERGSGSGNEDEGAWLLEERSVKALFRLVRRKYTAERAEFSVLLNGSFAIISDDDVLKIRDEDVLVISFDEGMGVQQREGQMMRTRGRNDSDRGVQIEMEMNSLKQPLLTEY